ncbi:MAG: hypothetical protein ACOC80_11950, partial [Petrotogales bacterium]
YWEHKFKDMLLVKNDSILLNLDAENKDILAYHRKWTEIEINFSGYENQEFNPASYHWKNLVVFPDSDDCKNFYRFTNTQEYPLVCWEVRHTDGTTRMYNSLGEQIGHGVPAPAYEALLLSGYDKGIPHDPWSRWRCNANKWFDKWVETTISIGCPTNEQISYYISDPDSKYFYEIAHSGGKPTRFQSSGDGIYYTAQQLQEDIKNREPMRLAIFCSCDAMIRTNKGTLSYEIRKGEMKNTVTIGYIGMGSCPGWTDSLDWQNCMFMYMDRGFTIKNAFNIACALYPKISDCVRFVGDEKIKTMNDVTSEKNYVQNIYQRFLKNAILQNMLYRILSKLKIACFAPFPISLKTLILNSLENVLRFLFISYPPIDFC